ncbi:hypothetical protein [uncultured Anaerococcus sp.]|uniref:hypothetical protein n=1 Tax=uncultured Anaerococcus sp. TaxID=293428 RepID=UPI00280B738E|nr:hypothetical protein [uncultured Anaerococcus sp.]MDU5149998.1 hypothetical protein [Anaerococcus prevotii]
MSLNKTRLTSFTIKLLTYLTWIIDIKNKTKANPLKTRFIRASFDFDVFFLNEI